MWWMHWNWKAVQYLREACTEVCASNLTSSLVIWFFSRRPPRTARFRNHVTWSKSVGVNRLFVFRLSVMRTPITRPVRKCRGTFFHCTSMPTDGCGPTSLGKLGKNVASLAPCLPFQHALVCKVHNATLENSYQLLWRVDAIGIHARRIPTIW